MAAGEHTRVSLLSGDQGGDRPAAGCQLLIFCSRRGQGSLENWLVLIAGRAVEHGEPAQPAAAPLRPCRLVLPSRGTPSRQGRCGPPISGSAPGRQRVKGVPEVMQTPRLALGTVSCRDRRSLSCPASPVTGALLLVSSAVPGRGCLLL